jgi:hypothetical protein
MKLAADTPMGLGHGSITTGDQKQDVTNANKPDLTGEHAAPPHLLAWMAVQGSMMTTLKIESQM